MSTILPIGFSSPAEALRGFLKAKDFDYHEGHDDDGNASRQRIRIEERQMEGVTIAYALRWDPWFKEWSFLTLDSFWRPEMNTLSNEKERPLLGTCVEGIRIVADTPGFEGLICCSIT